MLEGDSDEQAYIAHVVSLAGPSIHNSKRRLGFPSAAHRAAAILDDEWLRDAELAFLEWVPAGRFEAQIEVNNFRMVDTTSTPHGISSLATQ